MKPIIGVIPLWDEKKNSVWMLPGYLDGINEAGGLPIIFPLSTSEEELGQLVALCDGLLFTGGHDVSPDLYNEEALEGLVSCCRMRDEMENIVLEKALETDKPVLGICRGIQFINVSLGGTLYQDLPLQHPSAVEHHQKAPYDIPIHEVSVVADSPLHRCLAVEKLSVNSLHHQAVKELSPRLKAMAFSPDGLVEAAYMPEKQFLWAVQWHPEFSFRTDPQSRKIFKSFVEAARKNR